MNETQTLQLEILPANELTPEIRQAVVDLCSRAFEEDYEQYMPLLQGAVHVLGRVNGLLVTHGAWVPRWMQLEDAQPKVMMRTAYIEAIATDEAYRNRGYAASIMHQIAEEIQDFDIAGLSPFSVVYYAKLGWEEWQGELLIRKDGQLLPTILPPDENGEEDEECLMILRLPNTPELDLTSAISIEWRPGEVW